MERVKSILHDYLRFKVNTEVEIRFSTFVRNDLFIEKQPLLHNKVPENYKCVPCITRKDFNRVLNIMKSYNLRITESNTIDYFYPDYVRATYTNQDPIPIYVKKLKQKWQDIFDYNLRVCMSTETPTDTPDNKTLEQWEKNVNFRKKLRTSLFDDNIRYDFTHVTNHLGKTSYEIEMELLPTPSPNIDHILCCIRHMISLLQESIEILTLAEKWNISLEYSLLTKLILSVKRPYFIGAQPELAQMHVLEAIRYSVTEKYDGERFLAFISDNTKMYFFDRGMKVKSFGFTNTLNCGTILDVELVGHHIFVYDILFLNGVDLRGNVKYNLPCRLTVINKVLKNTKSQNFSPKLSPKKYYSNSAEIKALFDQYEAGKFEDNLIPRDGFIFTPLDLPYSTTQKSPNLFKWKPLNMTSIDFLVEQKSQNSWNLFVGNKDANIPFAMLPFVEVPPEWSTYDYSGYIIECVFVPQFLPIRVRNDKIKPNYRTIAEDTWKYIKNPISLDMIKQSTSIQKHTKVDWIDMRKYHNDIKRYLVDWCKLNYTDSFSWGDSPQHLRILDLACGRGGDLSKWSKIGVDYVGIDINQELLDEAIERSHHQNKTSTFQFEKMDLNTEFYQGNEPANVVSCQFALHYFMSSKDTWNNFTRTIESNISPGGIAIFTLFDGYKVYDYIKSAHIEKNFSINPILWNKNSKLENIKPKVFGVGINVSLHGDKSVILNQETTEYLVFMDDFIKDMQSRGFYLEESKLFENYDNHSFKSTHEKDYSSLHRYYIFRYLPKKQVILWNPVENDMFESSRFTKIDVLNMITGKQIEEKSLSKQDCCNLFNVCIKVNGDKEVIRPEVYLENVKTVIINDKDQLLAVKIEDKLVFAQELPLPQHITLQTRLLEFELTGKNCWKISSLRELAAELGHVIPSNVTKKGDIYQLLLCV